MNYSDHKNNFVSNSFSVTQCKTPVKRAEQWIRNLELGPAIPSSCGFPSFLALDGTQPWFSDLHPNLVSAQSCTWFTAPNPMLNLSPYNLCPISSSLLIFRSHWNPLPYLWVLKNQCLSAYLTTNLIHPHGSSGTYPQSCSQSSILVTGFPRKVRHQVAVRTGGDQTSSLKLTPFHKFILILATSWIFPYETSFKIVDKNSGYFFSLCLSAPVFPGNWKMSRFPLFSFSQGLGPGADPLLKKKQEQKYNLAFVSYQIIKDGFIYTFIFIFIFFTLTCVISFEPHRS